MENAHIITDKQTETQNRRKLRDYNISHVNSFALPPYQLGSVHGSFASFAIVSLYFFRLPSSYHFTVHSYVFFSSSLCDSVPPHIFDSAHSRAPSSSLFHPHSYLHLIATHCNSSHFRCVHHKKEYFCHSLD